MTLLLIIFGVTYALIASEKVEKAIAAGLGAAAVIVLHFSSYHNALAHVDLNVIFLLVGMMMIVNILSVTGLFEWVAVTIAKKARGNGLVILLLFVTVTAVFSSLLDNVTTVILIAPITILVCQILEMPVIPFLILEAVFSNVGGTATLVGDPPNVLIGSQAGLSFNAFLVNLAPIVLIIMAASLVCIYFTLGRRIKVKPAARRRIMDTEPALAIVDAKRLRLGLGVFALVLTGFFLGPLADVEPGIVALAGGLLMAQLCRVELHRVLGKVEWNTILFFIGLFILVGALQDNGVFLWLGRQVFALTRGNLRLTAITLLWTSAIVSAIVDNIPLVIAMIPLIKSLLPVFAAQMGISGHPEMIQAQVAEPLFWSLALGACLGGNGSLIGASANVVISQVARRNNYNLTFWAFLRTGLPMMILSLVLSTIYLLVRYFH